MNVCFCRLRAQFLGISLNSAVLPIFLSVSIFTSGSAAYVSIYLQLHLFARNCFLVTAGVQQRLFSNNIGSPMSYCHTLKIVREERPSWLFLESQQSLFMWGRLPRKVFDRGSERAKDSQRRPFLPYLIFVIFFTQAKFLENKIYTEKTRKLRQFFALLRQNTQ